MPSRMTASLNVHFCVLVFFCVLGGPSSSRALRAPRDEGAMVRGSLFARPLLRFGLPLPRGRVTPAQRYRKFFDQGVGSRCVLSFSDSSRNPHYPEYPCSIWKYTTAEEWNTGLADLSDEYGLKKQGLKFVRFSSIKVSPLRAYA